MKRKVGFIYFIQAGDLARFKIGCSQNCDRRLKELQTASPFKLNLIAKKKSDNMFVEEEKWHTYFCNKKLIGEWFELDYKNIIKLTHSWKVDLGIHYRDRTMDELIEGEKYFISFDSKRVIEVILENIPKTPPNHVHVRTIRGDEGWILFDDEVRKTEISALFNRVTM